MKMNAIIILSLLLKVAVSIPDADDSLHIYALPVGQGDCTVIQCPRGNGGPTKGVVTIIDAGASNSRGIDGEGIVNFLSGTKLNFAVITHSHRDHFSYMKTILDHYGNSYYSQYGTIMKFTVYHSCDWSRYKNHVKSNYAVPTEIGSCNSIADCENRNLPIASLCTNVDARLSFVASAVGECKGNANQDSIISKITYAGRSTLITGDFELPPNDMTVFLNTAGPDLRSHIYRLSHHGALNANPANLLNAIQAQYVFSSSGYRYGHPRCEIYDYYDDEKNPYHLDNSVPDHPYTCYNLVSGKYVRVDRITRKPIYVTSLYREKSPGEWIRSYYTVEFNITSCGHVGVKLTHIGDE